MSRPSTRPERQQSVGEEIANSVSHGIGLLAALGAAPVLVVAAVWRGSAAGVVGASVFAATLVTLYLASTLYHAIPASKAKRVFRVLDHAFYAANRVRYSHFVWHLFVITGTTCHFIAVLRYAA